MISSLSTLIRKIHRTRCGVSPNNGRRIDEQFNHPHEIRSATKQMLSGYRGLSYPDLFCRWIRHLVDGSTRDEYDMRHENLH